MNRNKIHSVDRCPNIARFKRVHKPRVSVTGCCPQSQAVMEACTHVQIGDPDDEKGLCAARKRAPPHRYGLLGDILAFRPL